MLHEFLQDQAAVYISGAMTREEREQFELILDAHQALREFVASLAEVGAAVTLATQPPADRTPSPDLKRRIANSIVDRPQHSAAEALVMTGADGFVQWVSPAFVVMCGYSLDELRGKKLGPLLQGAQTDRDTAERMRQAVHEYRPCRETILNYHKDGTPYWVDIDITPIFDGDSQPILMLARERQLLDRVAA